jgi:thioesterase domain-containing protein/acyl carrier protein
MLSGDWIPVSLPDRIRRLSPGIAVVSLGGATEAAIWSILHPIEEVDPAWTSIPYGRPMDNQSFHVLGPALEPRPLWVPGQLAIGGVGLARGYWRDGEKTRTSFFRHPRTGERLYRTGDLGRWLPDGTIEFLGREDFQVKVQGYRIELGEIESTLLQPPAVRACAVLAAGARTGSKRLVAYAVLGGGAAADAHDLESFLRARLPAWMVPAHVTLLAELPLTGNGKVDRGALARPEDFAAGVEESELEAPRDGVERELALIFEEVLEVRQVGRRRSFFDLGGHSLLAVRLMTRIEQRYGRSLPLAALFEAPTVEALALLLGRVAAAGEEVLVAVRPAGTRPPFFCVHPVGGSVLCYRELAQQLGDDQPFYALQVPEGEPPADLSLEALATTYVAAVRRRQPRGPYRLGGWSMGGVVAFEMARQMAAEGEEVELLALLDAERPGRAAREVDDATLASWFARDLSGLLGRDLAVTREELVPLAEEERLRLLLAQARAARLPEDIGLERLRQLLAVFRRNYRALLRYEAPFYAGGLTLLRVDRAGAEADPTLGWSSVSGSGVEVIRVPGDHYSMVRPPFVAGLAAHLRRLLVSTDSGHDRQPVRISAELPR